MPPKGGSAMSEYIYILVLIIILTEFLVSVNNKKKITALLSTSAVIQSRMGANRLLVRFAFLL